MTQLSITAVDNKNLFSNYYLDNQIKNNPEWKKDEHKAAFSEIKKLYDKEKDFLPNINEKQLEQRFFGPIFKILNHTIEVNEGTESQEFPDYAFFPDRSALDDAHKKKGTNSFYNNAFAIGEVKRWRVELDRFGRDEKDRKRNPSLQIWIYLHDVSPKWGILSNGAKWRLYCKDRRRDDYYEVDLPTLLATNDIEKFRYFYYFFRKEAFLTSQDGRIFLEDVLKGSADYAKEIGNDLKENVYRAMKKVAEGFFNWPENRLDAQNEEARGIVQKNTMILLYRLLFLLYAEGKGLLDLRAPRYESYSFDKLKKMITEKQDGPMQERYLPVSMELLSRLKSLFRLIDHGSEALGIPKSEFHVPAYNGGLFDPEKHPELEKWIIGDMYLADAIDLLSRSKANGSQRGFVDYSTLEIRHLGSIYEGLLEYKLQVADEDMVVNGGEWVKLEEYNKDRKQKKVFLDFDEFDRVKKGQLYLATDKGERKATGSYYTPDYIVNYIVKNTVGPVVDEKWKEAEEKKQSFVDATLSVKILDPAMGSGHFLVGSIEFLSGKLLTAAQRDIEEGRLAEDGHLTPDWARREVVAHCIYGVDLNDLAVELAKVSLWLTTISKDKPLSFLDHRLKHGNSLIGARLEDLPYYPDINAKKKEKRVKDEAQQTFEVDIERPFFDKIVKILNNLTDINDDTIENIHKKKDIFEKLVNSPEYLRIKALANLQTSIYFGVVTTEFNKQPKDGYYKILWALRKDEEGWRKDTNREWFGKARKLAEEKSFFHWELEFPEIFFEGGAPKENPGWDAVVGNPPYVRQEQLKPNKEYFKLTYETYHTAADLYIYFFEGAHKLLKNSGNFGFISSNKFMRSTYGQPLRQLLTKNASLKQIIDFGELPVFPEAATFPAIFLTTKGDNKQVQTIFAQIRSLDFQSLDTAIATRAEKLPLSAFSGNNWSLEKEEKNSILRKMDDIGESLGDYVNGNIRFGVKTGFNKAFIIDGTTRAKLIAEDPKNAEIIKPLIVGDDVRKYEINFTDKYLIWTHIGIDLEKYPTVRQYLEQYREQLEKRWDKGNFWYELRPCEYYSDFQKPKIVYPDIAITCRFCLDKEGYFVEATCFEIPLDDSYLLSLLNSNLMFFYIRSLTPVLGDTSQRGRLRFKTVYLKALPIRLISFTTPPDCRASLLEEAKALSTAPAPDSQKLLDFVSQRLSAAPEESDVVHDLLAYLAERMIEMNREKNAEIKSFLDFLKGETGA
ncbi:MAG TPA: TaqI-like C-terminal specificity domain-containing protein, partial [Candidatus Methanoperedens sp.]|nr:TaqI-like C-terminal specificity domain-containing protein [Candidatus Methanoperedens sp.]